MRNPWPCFAVAALTGIACVTYDYFFSFDTLWVLVVIIIALPVLTLLAYIGHERWLAARLNPYVMAYQSNHDVDKLKEGLDRWRPYALTKHSKNVIAVNWLSALIEQKRWSEAEDALEQLALQGKSKQDQVSYHLLRADYAAARGNTQLAEEERKLSRQLESQIKAKQTDAKTRANAQESKRALLCWVSFSAALLIGGFACVMADRTNGALASTGASMFILGLFTLPVTVGWLVFWLARRKA